MSKDRIERDDFSTKIFSELKSRLHARFIQYEVFVFGGKLASITLLLTNTNITIRLPYLIESSNEKDKYILHFKSREVEGSLQNVISYLLTTMRREESKLSKFKKPT